MVLPRRAFIRNLFGFTGEGLTANALFTSEFLDAVAQHLELDDERDTG